MHFIQNFIFQKNLSIYIIKKLFFNYEYKKNYHITSKISASKFIQNLNNLK